MQVRIEIDVKPEELRRFLGLPDVGGLQDDFIEYLREKVGSASEFDAPSFLRGNIDALKKSPALRRLLAAARLQEEEEEPAPTRGSARTSASKSASKRAAKKSGTGKTGE
ncbi:MAG: hypothetical protein L0H29_00420 [Sinobacteraceae bacterium]|nr:hypothetical protein [Nevskiaceae bacterium]